MAEWVPESKLPGFDMHPRTPATPAEPTLPGVGSAALQTPTLAAASTSIAPAVVGPGANGSAVMQPPAPTPLSVPVSSAGSISSSHIAAVAIAASVPAAAMGAPALDSPALYINRELSWLEFNARVLAEAEDPSVPLYERLKFLSIVTLNLDEFFMVRVAGLKQQLSGEVEEVPPDGMMPQETLAATSARAHALLDAQYRCWKNDLVPALAR